MLHIDPVYPVIKQNKTPWLLFIYTFFLRFVAMTSFLQGPVRPTFSDVCCFCLHLARLFEKWFAKRFSFCFDGYFLISSIVFFLVCKLRNLSVFCFFFNFFPRMSKKRSPPPIARHCDATAAVAAMFDFGIWCSLFALNFVIRFWICL